MSAPTLPISLCATWSATLCSAHPAAARLLAHSAVVQQTNPDFADSASTSSPRAELRILLTALAANRALIEADLLLPVGRVSLLPQRTLPMNLHITLHAVHVDIPDPDSRASLIALSFDHAAHLDRPANPIYARTSLLAGTGLIPAAFDPPTLQLQSSASIHHSVPAQSLAHATS
ncbi:MAG TPA: hypothetical protein VG711_06980 [Phycisphaerales bacterium]|nr:hypothetical protein [Phycisphaerales bacterium]